MPARSATGAICSATMPPSVAISRAAAMIASWRAASLRTTFSVRRYGIANLRRNEWRMIHVEAIVALHQPGQAGPQENRNGPRLLVGLCFLARRRERRGRCESLGIDLEVQDRRLA